MSISDRPMKVAYEELDRTVQAAGFLFYGTRYVLILPR